MANNCYFDLHVRGSKEGIEKMIQAFEDEIIGRVYNYNIYDQGYHKEENVYYVYIDGDCAWSIQSAMLDKHKIQEIIYVYRLDAEAYSEEIGIGFMEHYLYEYGELIKDECRDFFSFYIEDIEEDEEYGNSVFNFELVKKAGITKENYKQFPDCEGQIRIGGFDYEYVIN